jgi:hypothetical protein
MKKDGIIVSNNLELVLVKSGSERTGITAAFSEDAKQGIDNLDIFSPPSDFCDIFIAIHNTDIESNIKILEKEFRPEIGEGQEYRIILKNTSGEVINLLAKGMENFPGYEIYLVDKDLIKVYDLRKQNNIEVKKDIPVKGYILLIGTEEYMLNKKTGLLPTEYKLYQNYPNPFNPITTIMFSIPKQSIVSLRVYNILGELMVDLTADQLYDEGYYHINFDGSKFNSGIYFYTISSGSFINSRKMLLLK